MENIRNSRYFKPTPFHWRIVGDLAIVMIPVIDGIVAAAPNIDTDIKYWIAAGTSLTLVTLKFLTNLFK